jgi:hypothetical protein
MNLSTYNEEHPANFVINLSILHDTLTWTDIAKLFTFNVLDKYNSGDLRRVKNAADLDLRYKQTLVRFEISNGIIWEIEDKDLVDYIKDCVELLPKDNIAKLIKQGADLELSIGLFVPYGVCHYYPSDLLLSLGKLGISLKIDYYSGPGGGIRSRQSM